MSVSAPVTSNIASGNYQAAQTIVLSTIEATGSIYYTLDGSTPSDASTLYTAPIVLATGTKTYIKALTVTTGKTDSDVLTVYITLDESFLAKIRRAVRRNSSTDVDAELTDVIAECREDLKSLGVVSEKAESETDTLILGAVRCFARWKFGLSNDDASANREDYYTLRDEIRRRRDYISYAITFTCLDGIIPVADVSIQFNGEIKETNSSGTAIFYYVPLGVNQTYYIALNGYAPQEVDLDVTATATISIALVVV